MTDRGRDERFRPEDRLRRKAEFDRAYAKGKRIPSSSFVLIASPAEHDRPRLGVTVPRGVGDAVVRNAVRRRIREAFRKHRASIGAAIDLVIHVRPSAAGARFADLESELLGALRRYGARHGTGK